MGKFSEVAAPAQGGTTNAENRSIELSPPRFILLGQKKKKPPGRGREADAQVSASSPPQGRARAARVPLLFSDAEKSTRGGLGATPRLGATRCSRFFPTGIAGKEQASKYSPTGKTACPDLTSKPRAAGRAGPAKTPRTYPEFTSERWVRLICGQSPFNSPSACPQIS